MLEYLVQQYERFGAAVVDVIDITPESFPEGMGAEMFQTHPVSEVQELQ